MDYAIIRNGNNIPNSYRCNICFYVYVDPQGTDSYWLMNEIFNDLALLILLIFNLRVFIYVTLGNMIQNKLKTYMYNIYLDFLMYNMLQKN